MGKEGIKIAELDVNKLVGDLNKAYCDEWLAFYSYWYMSQVVDGSNYEDMSELLVKTAKLEFEHAEELGKRIIELGGVPTPDFNSIAKNANVVYPMPPAKTNDYRAMIDTVIKAEAGAIDVYQSIAKTTFGKDHVTYQLVVHILTEEIQHEERFEGLKAHEGKVEPALKAKPEPAGVR